MHAPRKAPISRAESLAFAPIEKRQVNRTRCEAGYRHPGFAGSQSPGLGGASKRPAA